MTCTTRISACCLLQGCILLYAECDSLVQACQESQSALQLLHALLVHNPDLARTHLDAFMPEMVRSLPATYLAQIAQPWGLHEVYQEATSAL